MSSRAAILQRVREALSTPAPNRAAGRHNLLGDGQDFSADFTPPGHAGGHPKDWLPAVSDSFEERVALFAKNAEGLKADFRRFPDERNAHEALRQLAVQEGWKRVASHRSPLNEPAVTLLALPTLWTDGGFDVADLEACDAGVTGCDALVAQTGSVLVTAASAGGRALSVLPPHHVVIARQSDLIADLPAAFDLLNQRYGRSPEGFPSFISFITGPSRTGDIERILVLGAHGPKQLTIFMVP